MSKIIRIGTRDSELALWQAKIVQSLLENLGHKTLLVPVKSTGDLVLDSVNDIIIVSENPNGPITNQYYYPDILAFDNINKINLSNQFLVISYLSICLKLCKFSIIFYKS